MDIFGKPKARTQFQNELDSKLKERKEKGLSYGLSDDEEDEDALDSDDDLLAAFNQTKQRPSVGERRERLDEKAAPAAPVKPQPRSSLAKTNKGKIKPKSALDALLDEDEEDSVDMMRTQKKPWTPPQFGEFKHGGDNKNNQEKPSPNQRKSLLKSEQGRDEPRMRPTQRSILEEDEDEELMSAYNQTLNRRSSPDQTHQSPFIRQTPSPSGHQSGKTTPRSELLGQTTPKSELTGRATPKSELTGRTTPKQEQSGRLTPKSSLEGRVTPKSTDGRRTPQEQRTKSPSAKDERADMRSRLEENRKSPALMDDPFGRKSPKPSAKGRTLDDIFGKGATDSEANSLFGSGQSTIRENKQREQEDSIFGRKSPSAKSGRFDDVFGKKAAREEPPEEQRQKTKSPYEDIFGRKSPAEGLEKAASPVTRKGSFMSSLLDDKPEKRDSSEERDIYQKQSVRKSSYLNNLLGDDDEKPKTGTRRTSFMDSLLADEDEKPTQRVSRSAVRKERSEEERESSVCRDVDKDPQMIEQADKEKQEKRAKRSGKPLTESQKNSDLIEDVADAQNKTMTYIEPQSMTKSKPQKSSSSTTVKPKPRKADSSPNSSTISFESASDIRNYIYNEWAVKKNSAARKQLAEKKRREKEQEELKRKAEEDKRLDSEATYRVWKEQKDERLRQKLREQKKLEKKKIEEEKDKQEKKMGAEICFKKWKESKDEQVQEKAEEKKDKKLETLRQKKEEKERKQKESEGAYSGWKKRKDQELKKTFRQTKLLETMQETEGQREKRRREREADKLYEQWLRKKAEQKKREKQEEKIRRSIYEEEPRPAWSPANRTIPYGR